MSEFFGGPEKIIVREDGQLIRIQPHTFSVVGDVPLPEDMESVILWMLAREFRGFYFTFKTHIGMMGPDTSTRVLMARVWMEGKEGEDRLYKEMKSRMQELIAAAPAFFSPGSFLANMSNRDYLHNVVKACHTDQPETLWVVWESGQ